MINMDLQVYDGQIEKYVKFKSHEQGKFISGGRGCFCPPPLKFAAMCLPPLKQNPEINPA
jgi:hypothetical protein